MPFCANIETEVEGIKFSITNAFGKGIFIDEEYFAKLNQDNLSKIVQWYSENAGGIYADYIISNYIGCASSDYESWVTVKEYVSPGVLLEAVNSNYTSKTMKEFAKSILDNINPYDKPIEKKKRKSSKGFIYLLKADNGFIKIGKAKALDSRIEQLGIQVPMKTELIYSFKTDDMGGDEKILHDQFAHKRDHGEWFRLDSEDIKEIKFFGGEDG